MKTVRDGPLENLWDGVVGEGVGGEGGERRGTKKIYIRARKN